MPHKLSDSVGRLGETIPYELDFLCVTYNHMLRYFMSDTTHKYNDCGIAKYDKRTEVCITRALMKNVFRTT